MERKRWEEIREPRGNPDRHVGKPRKCEAAIFCIFFFLLTQKIAQHIVSKYTCEQCKGMKYIIGTVCNVCFFI